MPAVTGPVLILGARSDIGRALAHRYAKERHPVILAVRGADRFTAEAEDIRIRHARPAEEITVIEFDVTAPPSELLARLPAQIGTVICVVGDMGEQGVSERDADAATKVMIANYVGPARVMDALVPRMAQKGTLIGISSVAGDRGRATNYVYGSAKAGFTAYLSGMRNRLAAEGLHVMTVKPGFVNTRMTEGMNTPKPLTAEPEEIANAIYKAQVAGRNVLYARWIWWPIMTIIGLIPEWKFKTMKI